MSKIKSSTLSSRNNDGTYITFSEIEDKISFSIDDEINLILDPTIISLNVPIKFPEYNLSDLPSPSEFRGCYITVNSAIHGIVLCRSNGTTWNIMANEGISVS